jgi:uncharacterized membrane protein YjjP (DUF1212 family)
MKFTQTKDEQRGNIMKLKTTKKSIEISDLSENDSITIKVTNGSVEVLDVQGDLNIEAPFGSGGNNGKSKEKDQII